MNEGNHPCCGECSSEKTFSMNIGSLQLRTKLKELDKSNYNMQTTIHTQSTTVTKMVFDFHLFCVVN
jgi:hypothetical protein